MTGEMTRSARPGNTTEVAARHLPLKRRSRAASAAAAEPRLQPRHTVRNATLLLTIVLAPSSNFLFAQCPDGSVPPCRSPKAEALDTNLLIVMPLELSGPQDQRYIAEGATTLLYYSLDGFAGWRVVNPQSASNRMAGSRVSLEAAAAFARTRKAGRMVVGQAIILGHGIHLRAELYDTRQGRRLTVAEATADLASPGPAIDSLATTLARERLRGSSLTAPRPIAEYATSSPEALRLFLIAEALQRHGLWQESVDTLIHALAIDSTFGLAYYRLYIASTMGEIDIQLPERWSSSEIARKGLHYANRLTRRSRDLLQSVAAQQEGRRLDAVSLADDLAHRYPDDAEAAYVQGESGWHFGLSLGLPPSRVMQAFERQLALDSASQEGRLHLVSLFLMTGDTTRALTLEPASELRGRIVRTSLRGDDPAILARSLEVHDLGSLDDPILQPLVLLDRTPNLAFALADSIAAVFAGRPDLQPEARSFVLLRRSQLSAARGRHGEAMRLLDAAKSLDPQSSTLWWMVLPTVLIAHPTDADRLATETAAAGPGRLNKQILLAWSAAETDDTTLYKSSTEIADSMLRKVQPVPWVTDRLAGIRGVVALRQGDSVSARRLLQASYAGAPYGRDLLAPVRADLSLLLARLDLAAGDLPAAWQRTYDTFWLGFLYRAEAEELRGQIAEQQGDTTAAVVAYRNFTELWKDADPELQPRVAKARETLARLQRP